VTNLRGGEWNSSELGEALWCSSRRPTAEEQALLSHVTALLAACELRYSTASYVQNWEPFCEVLQEKNSSLFLGGYRKQIFP